MCWRSRSTTWATRAADALTDYDLHTISVGGVNDPPTINVPADPDGQRGHAVGVFRPQRPAQCDHGGDIDVLERSAACCASRVSVSNGTLTLPDVTGLTFPLDIDGDGISDDGGSEWNDRGRRRGRACLPPDHHVRHAGRRERGLGRHDLPGQSGLQRHGQVGGAGERPGKHRDRAGSQPGCHRDGDDHGRAGQRHADADRARTAQRAGRRPIFRCTGIVVGDARTKRMPA